MAQIITYNKLIDILQDMAERHQNINTFFLGKNDEIGDSAQVLYPMYQVYPITAVLPITDGGEYKTINVTLSCKIVDLVLSDEVNERDVHSDCLRYAQDMINELNQHPFYINSNLSIVGDINLDSLEEFEDDYTAGWMWDMTFRFINRNSYCGLPFTELGGDSADGPGCADALVVNSDSSYSVNVASGAQLDLPDNTVTINSSSFSGYPSSVPLNIIVEDTTGTQTGSKVGNVWQVPSGGTSSIYYNRPWLKNTTQYSTYDEGWRIANGANDYNNNIPTNGIVQQIDFSGGVVDKLKYNNIHGNKFRFTGLNGGYYNQSDSTFYTSAGTVSSKATEFPYYVASRALIVDHLSGYMWISDRLGALSYDDNLAEVPTTNIEGYTDWQVPALIEWMTLKTDFTPNVFTSADREPFNMSQTTVNTCTTYHLDTSRYVIFNGVIYGVTTNQVKSTAAGNRAFFRIHLSGTIS